MVFGRGAEHEAITWNAPQWEGDGKMPEGGSHLKFLVWSKQLWLLRTSDAQFSVLRHSSFNPSRNSFGFLYGTPSSRAEHQHWEAPAKSSHVSASTKAQHLVGVPPIFILPSSNTNDRTLHHRPIFFFFFHRPVPWMHAEGSPLWDFFCS